MAPKKSVLPPRYRDPRRIGRGGMGEIFLATDTTLDRRVAVKLLADRYAEDASIRERFTREALAAARLSTAPNTVTIFDVGEWNGRPFIVMAYLDGGSLEDVLRSEGAQSPARALAWLEQAARALDAAHADGIVHRDVKPGNLLLDGEGVVYVADFGIASATGMDSLTMTGTILGTTGYLAPEQASGERATSATDRYALGVVAFELLTGTRPFQAETPAAEGAAHVHAPVPSISERAGSLPPELDAVLARALAKDPAARYGSCAELVAALRLALLEAEGATGIVRPLGPVVAPPRRARSGRPSARLLALAALLGGAALLGAILAAALVGNDEPTAAPKRTFPRTITAEGKTVTQIVTQPGAAPATPPSSPPASTDPVALTDQSTRLIRAGRYDEALPIAQQALAGLNGSGELYEAYANYNVGRSLVELGRCDEGLPHLDRSEQLQGSRKEIREARAKCA